MLQDLQSSRSYVRLGHNALLNHFSLIEALITHEPTAAAGDSLNHQISTKMPLLFRRFTEPVAFPRGFETTDQKKLWKLLYGVRSRFAHGDVADFRSGQFSRLGDFQAVERFVYLALKSLLKLALHEPDLVYDLKSC